MKNLLLAILTGIVLVGCSGKSLYSYQQDFSASGQTMEEFANPYNRALAGITVKVDAYNGTTKIRSGESSEKWANDVFFRTHVTSGGEILFHQLYMDIRLSNWSFFDRVSIKGYGAHDLTQIDRTVSDGKVYETVGLSVDGPFPFGERTTSEGIRVSNSKDVDMRLEGSRGNYQVIIPAEVINSYFDYIFNEGWINGEVKQLLVKRA